MTAIWRSDGHGWRLEAPVGFEDENLLDRVNRDVATVHELVPPTVRAIKERFPEWLLLTREPAAVSRHPERRRRSGIVITPGIGSNELSIDTGGDQGVDGPAIDAPQEALAAAQIVLGSTPIAIVSAHPPHAAARDETERAWRIAWKLRTYAALGRWTASRSHVIVGMDANAWVDMHPYDPFPFDDAAPQVAVDRFFHEESPAHGLHDAFRAWLADHPKELDAIRERRPHGPLALTYVRGGSRPVADRFDLFMVSPTMRVEAIEHNYEDAVAAGSDHAYVVAEFSVT